MANIETFTGIDPEGPEDIEVEDGEIRSQRSLMGVKGHLNKLHGEGNWGDEEVRQFIQRKKFEKWKEEYEANSVERRYEAYMESFENFTPNDEQTIRAMCVNEVQQANIARTIADTTITVNNADNMKKLHKIMTDLTTEHRQLQAALGIQRKTRKSHKTTALDAVKDQIERGRQFIEEKLIPITHCNIQMGWVLYHMQELPYEFRFTCARCGAQVVISGGDLEEAKKVIDSVVDKQ